MSDVFLKVVNMSISAGWLVLAVLVLRPWLRRVPRWIHLLLWGIVAIRLIFPFSIESALSLIPSGETIPPDIAMDPNPAIHSGVSYMNTLVNPVLAQSNLASPGDSVNPLQIILAVLTNIWVLGILTMLIYAFVSYFLLRRRLSTAVLLQEAVFQSEYVCHPFVLGWWKPRIYLPYHMDEKSLSHVLSHERAHIRRKDHWWKLLGFLLLSVYWFHPVMWLAWFFLCRDIELACDEKVIAELESEQRADYSQALLECSMQRDRILTCPLAFGEVGVKQRIRTILHYRKPTVWIVVVAIIICVAIGVCFLTNPLNSGDHLMLTEVNTSGGRNHMIYDVNLGNRALSGEIYVEEWTKGVCVRSGPVAMSQYVDQIEITMEERREDDKRIGTEIEITTNQYGGSLLTYYPVPKEMQILGWSFAGYERNQKVPVDPEQDVILAVMAFDGGNGVRTLDCQTLAENPERLADADYMLVVRAAFDSASLGTVQEGVSPEICTILYAKVLEIQDSCFLVEPIPGSWELSSADQIEVSAKNLDPAVEPKIGDILQIEYDGILLESYPARAQEVYRICMAQEPVLTMIPMDTEYEGFLAGALLLPMDGDIYRYELWSEPQGAVLKNRYLGTYSENVISVNAVWDVYSLEEYPDHSIVLAESETEGSWLYRYSPPRKCADSALADVKTCGYVVMEDGIATYGQEMWQEFYENTQKGQPASVSVAQYGTLNPESCAPEYLEAYAQDYPYLNTFHLTFDGEIYTLSFRDQGTLHTRTYEYLMKYDSGAHSVISAVEPEARWEYVLTHDDTVTLQQLWSGLTSSMLGAYIDHYSIYSEAK